MMSRPVTQLAKLARRVEQGEETTRLDVPTSIAELRQLVDAVRGMASTLIHRKLALEDSNTRLEQRVQERTAELERLNGELVYEVSPPDEVERVTVSVGVATANPQQDEADEKLYEAKHAGRNCVAS
jgi:GGDEF domain-containing protein